MRSLIFILLLASIAYSQTPSIEPGVSQELAGWRAAHYSDVHYKLDLTLEKMSPVLKGTIEIRLKLEGEKGRKGEGESVGPIILDWRKLKGFEDRSTVSNVSINGRVKSPAFRRPDRGVSSSIGNEGPPKGGTPYEGETSNGFEESNEHLIFRDGVVAGENVIKLDFTSPILPSGSAITRYVDKEDGSEYIYSLFVPSDASTAFPVFDQPDLKARFSLTLYSPEGWERVSNTRGEEYSESSSEREGTYYKSEFVETKPISTYVFAFAAGPFARVSAPSSKISPDVRPELKEAYKRWMNNDVSYRLSAEDAARLKKERADYLSRSVRPDDPDFAHIYIRKSQLAKFKPHAAEVFRLNREGIKFLEEYFAYKFPFPKYDLVLIPEFPFGGMEHAGATFLRESSVIFPSEPTSNDHISRANLIFHEAAHQWFGDTVTMRWFDDLWLKEGFAEFMAYKTLEKVMPQYNAWKVFYERNKQAAYLTDSTKGTTPIYQEIKNLSAAKSAYGNIVYRKAPSFLKQAEFYLGADKFQSAVRAFLKKYEFANAEWKQLVDEFALQSIQDVTNEEFLKTPEYQKYKQSSREGITKWAEKWVTHPGLTVVRYEATKLKYRDVPGSSVDGFTIRQENQFGDFKWRQRTKALLINNLGSRTDKAFLISDAIDRPTYLETQPDVTFFFPNYQDYGYGIFLLDDKSRDYVLKNIQNERDDFLRSMMWGALWDSVREGELDPKEYVELALRVLSSAPVRSPAFRRPANDKGAIRNEKPPEGGTPYAPQGGTPYGLEDESTTALLLNRVSTAMTYYIDDKQKDTIAPRLEAMLIDKMRTAPTLGQRITFYRAFLNVASTASARQVLKDLLRQKSEPGAVATGEPFSELPPRRRNGGTPPKQGGELGSPVASAPGSDLPLKTKDRFDIVTRLASLGDPDAEKLLTELERTETSDDAKRYAYAARAAFPTKETKEKYWIDFTGKSQISESWIEAAFGPFNSVRHADLTMPYLERALKELPNHKRNRKIFFVNGWLAAFIGGQRSEEALAIVNKFLADNPNLDGDLRLKILENVDVIERAVKIRKKYAR